MVKLNREGCINFITNFARIVILVFFIAKDDIGKVGDLVTCAGIKGQANICIISISYTRWILLNFSAIRHIGECMVYIHGNRQMCQFHGCHQQDPYASLYLPCYLPNTSCCYIQIPDCVVWCIILADKLKSSANSQEKAQGKEVTI